HRAIRVALDHRFEHLLEAAVRLEVDRPLRHGKMLQRGLMTVRALCSLERDHDFPRRVRGAALQRVLLAANGIVQDLAEDAPHECGIETESLAKRRAMLQQRSLTL